MALIGDARLDEGLNELLMGEEEEEEAEDEDEMGGADDFFMSERPSRKSPRMQRDKRTLSALQGLSSTVFSDAVHTLMTKPASQIIDSERERTDYQQEYSAWYARLHAGFSVLLHGLGSKMAVLNDFSSHLAELGPVFTLNGYALGASIRDLLYDIFHALRISPPAGTSAILCAHLRHIFMTAAKARRNSSTDSAFLSALRAEAARPGSHASDGILGCVLKLLPPQVDARGTNETTLMPTDESEPGISQNSEFPLNAAAPQGDEAVYSATALGSAKNASMNEDGEMSADNHSFASPMVSKQVHTPHDDESSSPTQRPCAAPGCTFPAFHSGGCSHVLTPMDSMQRNSPPSKRLRRARDNAMVDRIEFDALGPAAAAVARQSGGGAAAKIPSHVYIVIHGIDAPALRMEANQSILTTLASLPQVHLIGSTAHRNSALLWDAQQTRQLNPLWMELSTAQPYAAECLDTVHKLLENLQDASESSEVRSAHVVLEALTTNARQVFLVLVQHQLDHPKSAGLSFPALYAACREKLCVSSEAALKGHVTEFIDHHLVRTRRGANEKQCYYCTLSPNMMQKIIAEPVSDR